MSDAEEGFQYFTSKVVFGKEGVQEVLKIGELNEYEKKRLVECKEALKTEIETGLKYAEENSLCD
jgi:malate dehydrogenase